MKRHNKKHLERKFVFSFHANMTHYPITQELEFFEMKYKWSSLLQNSEIDALNSIWIWVDTHAQYIHSVFNVMSTEISNIGRPDTNFTVPLYLTQRKCRITQGLCVQFLCYRYFIFTHTHIYTTLNIIWNIVVLKNV